MKKEFGKGRWSITFIKVRKGYFHKSFKTDKQKVGNISLYIRRGWYPYCKIKGHATTYTD